MLIQAKFMSLKKFLKGFLFYEVKLRFAQVLQSISGSD